MHDSWQDWEMADRAPGSQDLEPFYQRPCAQTITCSSFGAPNSSWRRHAMVRSQSRWPLTAGTSKHLAKGGSTRSRFSILPRTALRTKYRERYSIPSKTILGGRGTIFVNTQPTIHHQSSIGVLGSSGDYMNLPRIEDAK